MNYVFFGSPRFAAIVLEKLLGAGMPPIAVVCNPDRPVGKKKILTAPPVKIGIMNYELRIRESKSTAEKIKIFQPEKPSEIGNELVALVPDFFVVAAYAHIIGGDILNIPRLGTIGVHPSLLPKYRGATPIQSALLVGEKETGVTLFLIDEKMDHGPILMNNELRITNNDTYFTLEGKLALLGGEMLVKLIPVFFAGKIKPAPQNHGEATFARKFETADAEADFQNDPPEKIYRMYQAFTPEPGLWSINFPNHEGERVKILEASFAAGKLAVKKIHIAGKKPRTIG